MMDRLPGGWASVELRDHVYIAGRIGWRGLKAEEYTTSGPILLSVPNLNHGNNVNFVDVNHISRARYDESPEIQLRVGDTLLVKDGAGIGKLGFVADLPSETTVNSSLLVVRPNDGLLDPKYLFYYLKGPQFQEIALQRITGSATPHLFQKDIKTFQVVFPARAEQRRIVERLDKLVAEFEQCKERISKIPALLKRFRRSVLTAACSGRLTADWREARGIDDNWPTRQTRELGIVSGGITKNAGRQKLSLQVPYLRVANVYENRLDLSEIHKIGVTQPEMDRTRLIKGDLLFVEGNGSLDQIGRVALWDGSIQNCVHQNHLIKFRSGPDVIPGYVLLQMMAPAGRSQLMDKATSSAGLNTLSISKISDVEVPVATLPEQIEITQRVEALFTLANRIEARYIRARKQVDRVEPSLLAKAFRGELVSTEAELAAHEGRSYESAEQLLGRIRLAIPEVCSQKAKTRQVVRKRHVK